MRISPSGQLIAFRKVQDDKDFLYVYSLAEKKVVRITDVSAIAPRGMYFTSDERLLIWASEYRRISGYLGHHNVSAAFRLDIPSGEIEQLLKPGYKIHKGQTNVGVIAGISNDGKHAFMPAYVGRNEVDQSPEFSLMRVDIKNPRKVRRVERGTDHTRDYFLDINSEILAIEDYHQASNLHSIKVKDGSGWKTVFEMEAPIRTVNPVGLTPDSKNLVVLLEHQNNDKMSYQVLSLEDGSITDSIYNRTDKDIERVYQTFNKVAIGVRYSGFTPSYKFFDKETNDFVQAIVDRFPEHSVWITSHTPNWSHALIMVEGSQFAGDYFLIDRKLNTTFLASQRPSVQPEHMHPIASLHYNAQDGLSIPALLTIPRKQVQTLKNLPLVVLPHGGPESYDRIGFDWMAQALANEGYLVFQPQFRGSDGFGGEFTRAGWGEWGKKMQSDITDGVKFLIEKQYVNPNKVCIFGWSYGGYAALMAGSQTPNLYQCIVAGNAVADLPLMLSMEKRDHGKDSWVLDYWERSMARKDYSKDDLKAVSPSYSAENFAAPVLLIHGERDKVVPIKQAKRMYKALKKADKDVSFIELDNDNHFLMENKTRLQALTEAVNFINKHIGQ